MRTRGMGAAEALELSRLGVFGATGIEGLQGLLSQADLVELQAGETLIETGAVGESMFIVLSGSLHVFLDKGTQPVAEILAGDTAGEVSLLDKQPASATVKAHDVCRLVALNEDTFWGVVQISHAFALTLLSRLASRLRANNQTVLEKEQLRRHFEFAAFHDALTGVRSRRWLEDTLPRLLQRYERDGRPLCIAMVDVDHFKRFNDQHGHQAGDEVLRGVAQALAHRLRPTDFVARYGGEEFCVILPNTPLDGADVAANRVRELIAAEAFEGPDGTELPRVTISIGIAQANTEEHAHALVSRADAALYRAKEAGRNCVQKA